MITQKFINQISKLAQIEIDRYHAPSHIHYSMAIAKGKELAQLLDRREDLVTLGTILMDIKLGEAFNLGKLDQHIKMSLDYAKSFCESNQELTAEEKDIIYNSVESHHGAIPHNSVESEIVTNADCYRFIHPLGVFEYIRILSSRFNSSTEIVAQAGSKLNEKWALISLPIVKEELKPHYKYFTELFTRATKDF